MAILWIKRCNIKCYTAYNIPLRQDSVTILSVTVYDSPGQALNTKEKNMHFFLLSFFSISYFWHLFCFRKILFAVPFLQSFRALAPISFGLRLFKVVYRMTQTCTPWHYLKFIYLPHCEASGIFVPQSGLNPGPCQWDHGVPTTEPLGNPPRILPHGILKSILRCQYFKKLFLIKQPLWTRGPRLRKLKWFMRPYR